ncbi:hypothetical protein DPMN_138154 [Dreissena polymorpha]|uniref:Uncharacterized protein n=1 Tax=Dreissena polymorpha TaxID=45954 RepID=A0A9D4G732_DREPO|nr:hypothetical protein DPMN_138154 [Dreissena polymorpha]
MLRKNAPPTGGHVFQATGTIFKLFQNIIGTNLLTKFHDHRTINKASRELTGNKSCQWKAHSTIRRGYNVGLHYIYFIYNSRAKNATPLGGHVFPPTKTIFKLIQDIFGTNHLTKFHDDRTINVASRVLIRKNAPPPGGHVFKATETILKLIQDIIGTNLLTNFHEDWNINVASRVLTRKNAPPPGVHVFQATGIIFELVQDIIGMNLLTKFHEDRTINVASRVENAPPLGSHVFQANVTIFKHIQDIIENNLLTKFHEDWTINVASRVLTRNKSCQRTLHYVYFIYNSRAKNAPPLGSHVFQANVIIFELIQDIIETNLLTKFHEDWTINVASSVNKVLTREENCPAPWRPYINETNVLTKFHDDWAKIVTSRVFTRNTAPPPGGHVFQQTGTIFKLNQYSETSLLRPLVGLLKSGLNSEVVLIMRFHEFDGNIITTT